MSSDPNKQGQYPPPQWESQPQRGAYPAPSQALNYRVRLPASSSTYLPRRISTNLALSLLPKITEVPHQHQARWSLYPHLSTRNTIHIQGCILLTTCILPTRQIQEVSRRRTWDTRVSRHRGRERPSRVDTADGARYILRSISVAGQRADRYLDSLLGVRSIR